MFHVLINLDIRTDGLYLQSLQTFQFLFSIFEERTAYLSHIVDHGIDAIKKEKNFETHARSTSRARATLIRNNLMLR